MRVYAVVCKSWNGEYTDTEIEVLYLNESDARAYAEMTQLKFHPQGPHSPEYRVREMEVF